jgi:hypothetical protein
MNHEFNWTRTGKPLVDWPATAFREPQGIVADSTDKWIFSLYPDSITTAILDL